MHASSRHRFTLLRVAGLALALALGCASRAAPQGAPSSAPPPAPAPPEARAASTFAARAPARTRLLLSAGSYTAPVLAQLDALMALFPECQLKLTGALERVEVALAEPAELRIDLTGAISVSAAQCLLDTLVQRQMLATPPLQVTPLPHGVRIATQAALQDGPGGAAVLTRRFEELSKCSHNLLVSDTAPSGLYEAWVLENGDVAAAITLSTPGQALEAANWLARAARTSGDAELAKLSATAHDARLHLRLPEPGPDFAFLLKRELIEAFRVPSASMQPTLMPGDFVFAVNAQRDRALERGDVVAFASPQDASQVFVKRVIGLPGDRIRLDGHAVQVNGERIDAVLDTEKHVREGSESSSEQLWRESLGAHHCRVTRDSARALREPFAVTVPAGRVFVLGDNRDSSHDSRHFGSVPLESLRGRLVLIYAAFWEGRVRWERFGVVPD